MGHVIPVDTVKAVGTAVTDRRIADFRGASPKFGCRTIIPDDKAVSIAEIDADRQEIEQPIGNIEGPLVQQVLERHLGVNWLKTFRHASASEKMAISFVAIEKQEPCL
jgi:hypothetical protein